MLRGYNIRKARKAGIPLGRHTIGIVHKPFYGCITHGAATFAPNFRALREGKSGYLFALLDDDITGGSLTITSSEIQELKGNAQVDPQDLSQALMEDIIAVEMSEGVFTP